jgi:hypothetical protein
MKKWLTLSLIILATIITYAQKEVPTPDQIAQFKKSKTLIVLDDNPLMRYNFKIREAVENVWSITPTEFISTADYEIKRMDKAYSFITLDQVFFTKDKTQAQYNFLCLSLGGDYKNQSDMPQLCTVPVSYFDVDEESYIYKLSALLDIVQDHILFIENHPEISDINVIKKYNDNAYLIKQKTLYIIKDEMDRNINSDKEVKAMYPYSYKFVSREELEDAIDKKAKDVVFLHKVGPESSKHKARCYKTMIGADDSKLYYFDYHMINAKNPDGLLARDLKKIAKAKQK